MGFEFQHDDKLEAFQKELADLLHERNEIDRRIFALQQTIGGLIRLRQATEQMIGVTFSPVPVPPPPISATMWRDSSLVDHCRNVLRFNGGWMAAGEVFHQLESSGIQVKAQNPISAVATTLGRLEDVETKQGPDGRTRYKWKGGFHRARYQPGRKIQ